MTIEMKPQSKSITAGKNSDGTSRRPYKNKPLRRTKDENVAAASGHSRIDSGSIEDSSKSSPADILAEVFPTWNMDDLMAILTELDGDVELAITRISEGILEGFWMHFYPFIRSCYSVVKGRRARHQGSSKTTSAQTFSVKS